MSWCYDAETKTVTCPENALTARPYGPRMRRDQDYDHGGVLLLEDGFAVRVSFAPPKSHNGPSFHEFTTDGRLILTCAGFHPATIGWDGRDLPHMRSFDTLDRQRSYLSAIPHIVAALPQTFWLRPGTPPQGEGIVVRLPEFRPGPDPRFELGWSDNDRAGHWSPYSDFLLSDPGD